MIDDRIPVLNCWRGAIQIEPLAGGITNRNFLVCHGDERFVARVCEDRSFLGIDRRNERLCQVAAQRARVAPALVHAENEVLVTRFIDGATLQGCIFDADLIGRLAALLKQLHVNRDELTGEMLFFCPFQTVRTYAATARRIGATLPAEIDAAIADANRLSRELNDYRPTLCHNDLLPANVLDDGKRLWLIDWEYAGIGNPLFDLASVSANCRFDDERDAELVRAYSGTVDADILRQIQVLKTVSLLREALWGVIQTVKSEVEFDYAQYAADNFEAYRANRKNSERQARIRSK